MPKIQITATNRSSDVYITASNFADLGKNIQFHPEWVIGGMADG